MKVKNVLTGYLLAVLFFSFSLLLGSCSKTGEEDKAKTNTPGNQDETEKVDAADINETGEDLFTVDYRQFYDELSPHGEWVQVSAEDLGIDESKLNPSAALMKSENDLFAILSGVKTAYASEDVGIGAFFVWRPSPEIAVTIGAASGVEQPAVGYVPYTNGQWVNSDAGWYFQAATPYEEVTSHYGRWAYTPAMGWVWVPGRVWAPAWVDWREDDDYVAWTPLLPGTYIESDVIVNPYPVEYVDRYVVVEKRYFCEPDFYHHIYWDREHWDRCRGMDRREGIIVTNKMIIDRGPDIVGIERVYGRSFEKVKINRVDNISKVKFSGTEINTFSPHFMKNEKKDKHSSPLSAPGKYKQFSEMNAGKKDNVPNVHGNDSKMKDNKNKNDNITSDRSGKRKYKNDTKENKGPENKQQFKQKIKPGNNKQYKGRDNNGNDKRGKDKKPQNERKNGNNNTEKKINKNPGEKKQKNNDQRHGNDSPKKRSNDSPQKHGNDNGKTKHESGVSKNNKGNNDSRSKGNDTHGNDKRGNNNQGNNNRGHKK